MGTLTVGGSTLYGMTCYGGAAGDGNIFSVGTDGSGFESLLSFSGTGGAFPGAYPWGGLTISGSTLYGMTMAGGTATIAPSATASMGWGAMFQVGADGSGYDVAHSFGETDGASPLGDLVFCGSGLYGTTLSGGASSFALGKGVVFQANPAGAGYAVIHSFQGGNGDGASPNGTLTVCGSILYGMTTGGGDGSKNLGVGYGTIFEIDADGSGFNVLHTFQSGTGDGTSPYGSLVLSGSTLYGMTRFGGSTSAGTIFKIGADGGGYCVLHSFLGSSGEGAQPWGDLTLVGSTLYGITSDGGNDGDGTIFSIHTDGSGFQTLLSFTGASGACPGAYPYGSLTLVGSTFYGMTSAGGTKGGGVVFSLTLPSLAVGSALSWVQPDGGSWSSANNWDGGRAPGNSPQDTANFGSVIGSNTATVTLDGSWTIGALSFSTTGGGSYVIARAAGDTTSTLTLASTGGSFPLTNNGGNHTIAVPVILGSNLSVSATAGSSLTVSGPISGGGSLTKVGAGAMILAGSNLYSGGTEVDNGTLVAANGANGSATGSGNVVLSGGTLAAGAGGGSISGGVLPGAGASTIAAGGVGPSGNLTIGSLTTASNMTLNFDLPAPGSSSDLLTIVNGLTLAPGTAITFSVDPTAEGDYRLIGGKFGTPPLSYFILPAAPSNRIYALSTTVDPGFIDLTVVPEPSALALLGVAAIGLLGCAWRRRGRTA